MALLPLGALTGSFLASLPLNYLGRKPTIILSGNHITVHFSQDNIFFAVNDVPVADEEEGRCLDPEGNGVNPGGGNGGGPGPPGGEQDKQLISSRGGGNTLMEQPRKIGRRVWRDMV